MISEDEMNVKHIRTDWTPLANIGLINQGFLRTIIETQSTILAYLQNKDQEVVVEELYERVNENIEHAVDEHKYKFPGSYLDID